MSTTLQVQMHCPKSSRNLKITFGILVTPRLAASFRKEHCTCKLACPRVDFGLVWGLRGSGGNPKTWALECCFVVCPFWLEGESRTIHPTLAVGFLVICGIRWIFVGCWLKFSARKLRQLISTLRLVGWVVFPVMLTWRPCFLFFCWELMWRLSSVSCHAAASFDVNLNFKPPGKLSAGLRCLPPTAVRYKPGWSCQ